MRVKEHRVESANCSPPLRLARSLVSLGKMRLQCLWACLGGGIGRADCLLPPSEALVLTSGLFRKGTESGITSVNLYGA
jgi:hypothetical protein